MEEFEIKFLEVDVPELEKKLIQIGAKKVGEYNYRRMLLDYGDNRLGDVEAWIRLRTDGKESTLTYKQRLGVKSNDGSIQDEGIKEIEIVVDSYEKTYEILKAVGFVIKRREGNRRVRFKKADVVFDIDFWPQIPTYLEVESSSYEKVKGAARELGFNPENGIIGTAGSIYKKYGYDINDYSSMTFDGFVKK